MGQGLQEGSACFRRLILAPYGFYRSNNRVRVEAVFMALPFLPYRPQQLLEGDVSGVDHNLDSRPSAKFVTQRLYTHLFKQEGGWIGSSPKDMLGKVPPEEISW